MPSVVAVVVTHNPGLWFDETLTSLANQDYRNFAILVIDAGSEVDLTDRIESLAPDAYVRRLRSNPGFATAANMALEMVEGAAFYLFCHDDVALEPGAVKQLVEEAYRSNAGLLGPKLVRWDHPDRLQAAGLQSDKFGHPVSIAEPDELDQEQHDAVRDVFFVPSSCLLIRADLFRALGGFDEGIPLHGEDTDLCWRAHLAGARVLVMPARVRHVEALSERRDDDSRRLQMRHRLRMVLSNYGLFYLAAVLPQQMLLSLAEFLGAIFTGRFRHAGDVVGAYVWNLRDLPSIVAKRRRVRRIRQITDLELRRLQVRGSARAMTMSAPVWPAAVRLISAAPVANSSPRCEPGSPQGSAIVVAVFAVVARSSAPATCSPSSCPPSASSRPRPNGALEPAREWWSGWRSTGLGSAGSVPFLLALQGGLGALLLGSETLARHVLIVGLLPLGYLGAWRLGRLPQSGRSQVAVLAAYAANPIGVFRARRRAVGGAWPPTPPRPGCCASCWLLPTTTPSSPRSTPGHSAGSPSARGGGWSAKSPVWHGDRPRRRGLPVGAGFGRVDGDRPRDRLGARRTLARPRAARGWSAWPARRRVLPFTVRGGGRALARATLT